MQGLYSLPTNYLLQKVSKLGHVLNFIEDDVETDIVSENNSPIFFVYKIILLLGFTPYK
ncbi:MAG: hypothetical protein PHO23_02685 [Candidatus Pacebacteria bacterium]|nr:hypothetical protein [Candidatus Paceibacterota bacterium]